MKKIYLLIAIAIAFSGCEKDDICDAATSTTPRIIIQFYDNVNTTELKNVSNLQVTGVGLATPLTVFNGVSTIKLPLKTDMDVTKYSLILNSTSTTGTNNEDFLEFNYTSQSIFVSRACGFKSVFALNTTNGVLQTNAAAPDESWIQSITIETNTIENEDETHIKIYF